MIESIVGSFAHRQDAEDAIQRLVQAGIPRDGIQTEDRRASAGQLGLLRPNVLPDVGTGAAVGAAAGLLVGLVALVIPGVGPLFTSNTASGVLVSVLIGAAAGAILSAAMALQTGGSAGETRVAVKASGELANRARAILNSTREPQASPQPIPNVADPDAVYRNHFAKYFASSGFSFQQIAPAYHYGQAIAEQSIGAPWHYIEPQAGSDWEQRNPGTWNDVKNAVQFGWQQHASSLSD